MRLGKGKRVKKWTRTCPEESHQIFGPFFRKLILKKVVTPLYEVDK